MRIHVDIQDGITPDLQVKIAALRDRRPLLKAMGMALVSLAMRSFSDPSARPATWGERKKKTGKPLLIASSLLSRSPRVVEVTNDYVEVGTDRPYAAVHQFGSKRQGEHLGRGSNIPARPFWPLVGTPANATPTREANSAILAAARRQTDAMLGL